MSMTTHVAKDWYTTWGSLRASDAIGVYTHPGATEFTRPLGAIDTISFLSDNVSPYINAIKYHELTRGLGGVK